MLAKQKSKNGADCLISPFTIFCAVAAVPAGPPRGEGAAHAALRREGRAGDGGGAGASHPRPASPL